MLVTMLSQTLYFLVDLYWVGSLGKEAVAAVGIAGNLSFIVLACTQVLGVGTTTLIAHASGARDGARARDVFHQSQWLAAAAAVLFLIVAMAGRGAYIGTLAADAATAQLADGYLRVVHPGAGAAVRAGDDGRGPARLGRVPHADDRPGRHGRHQHRAGAVPDLRLGHRRARSAWRAPRSPRSWRSSSASLAHGAVPPARRVPALHRRRRAAPAGRRGAGSLAIGLPAGAEFSLMAVYMFLVLVVARPFGSAAQAGFGIGLRLVQALFLPVVALAFSAAPVAGQNVGARRFDRVRQTLFTALGLTIGLMLIVAVVCQFAAAALVGVFSADPAVIGVGADYLRIISWGFACSGIVFVSSSIFQALGRTIPPLLTSFLRNLAVFVPVLWLAAQAGLRPDA